MARTFKQTEAKPPAVMAAILAPARFAVVVGATAPKRYGFSSPTAAECFRRLMARSHGAAAVAIDKL